MIPTTMTTASRATMSEPSAPSRIASDELLALVEAARKGDRDSFAALYRARIAPIMRYVQGLLRPGDPIEDAVADTFIEAWRDLPRLRQPAAFDGWLYRIAHRRALSYAAKRSATVDLDAVAELADDGRDVAPEAMAERAEERDHIRKALLRLPDEQREVLVLRHFQGLSHREIGAALGKSEEAVRAQHYRAARELRGHLAEVGLTAD
jgi:RNA polymerase sigma-70 factor (ECF subfamily)